MNIKKWEIRKPKNPKIFYSSIFILFVLLTTVITISVNLVPSSNDGNYAGDSQDVFLDIDGKPIPFINYVKEPSNIQLVATAYGKTDAIRLIDNSNTTRQEIRHTIGEKTNGTIEFWILTTSSSADTYFRFYDQYGTMSFQVWFIREVGVFWIKQGNTGNSATNSRWYHYKIEFEFTYDNYKGLDKNRINVWKNGYQKLSNYPCYGFSFDSFRVLTSVSGISSAYISDFIIIE